MNEKPIYSEPHEHPGIPGLWVVSVYYPEAMIRFLGYGKSADEAAADLKEKHQQWLDWMGG